MKTVLTILLGALAVGACNSTSGTRRDPIRQCPVGMVLVCESKTQTEASRGGPGEEIPAYEFCRCVQQGN